MQTPLQTVVPVWNADSVLSNLIFSREARHLNFYVNVPITKCQQQIQIFRPRVDQQNMSVGLKGQREKTDIRTQNPM